MKETINNQGIMVRRVGKYGAGWSIIISDGYCSYRYNLSKVSDKHSINSMARVLIKVASVKK